MKPLPSLSEAHSSGLTSNAWFASLPRAVQEKIVVSAWRRALAPGERLFSRGDESDGVYGVLEGMVKVSGVSREGRQTVLDFYGPGSWIGEVATLEGQPRAHDAEAHGPTVALQVSPADLEELLAAHPTLSRALLRLEAQRLRIVLAALEQYSVQSLEQRLANRLLMLASNHKPGSRNWRGCEGRSA